MRHRFFLSIAILLLVSGIACTSRPTPESAQEVAEPTMYEPTWTSLGQYECPDWFRDAKFGIWAHSSPQDVPMQGDWYARNLYVPGHENYEYHLAHYGHPSAVGYKDLCRQWTLDQWSPEKLMQLYRRAGARYFVALANHHCNFDTWNSAEQPWNAVNVGPKRDVIGEWQQAATAQGIRFGVSVHNINTWGWYLPAFRSDSAGPKAGVPYDGVLTKADGEGQWWEGLDPQQLYGPAQRASDTIPTEAFVQNWYDRVKDLLDHYHPDLLYFDSYIMGQSWRQFTYHGGSTYAGIDDATKARIERTPFKEAGIDIITYYYNQNPTWHGGQQEAVLNLKLHDLNDSVPERYKKGMVIDRELGGFGGGEQEMQAYPWQKDRPFGGWHYNEHAEYPTTQSVIWNLVDVVSKNGNLLLGMPMRPNGTLNETELTFLQEMGDWMEVHGEGIYGTRPWKTFGDEETVRYTQKGDTVYAFVKGNHADVLLPDFSDEKVNSLRMLGYPDTLSWQQDAAGLHVTIPARRGKEDVIALKVEL
ncbi:alpha-L-fucosidase [Catalinimonas alkaloidigena]|uniref:alpha-L-fucosidase n=1 Tax=Catalinimonas alkaloidigena TaxID=1075417 RepID=A0A1G9QGZ2_9BACT|nr:alpha-L-fucosidase [Catalinimonas alkaloidigena]SDM10289.1 alpha-L-fucosidase [Catalinimonas alkaloidigena]